MNLWNKIKKLFTKQFPFEKYELSPRGECVLQYCIDITEGKEVYIASYEEVLERFMRQNDNKFDRRTAAAIYAEILSNMKRG